MTCNKLLREPVPATLLPDPQGTRPYNVGEGPEPAAVAAAATLGLALPPDHAARLFEPADDIVRHDLLLVMDKYTAGDVMREVGAGRGGGAAQGSGTLCMRHLRAPADKQAALAGRYGCQ